MSHESAGSDSRSTSGVDGFAECDAPVVRDHTLLRRIGRGSYGDVWLAKNSTGAFRAVKIVYRRAFKDTRPFEREFSGIQKFEPVSRSHEGFIDILQVGINEDDEYFYYIMELGDDEHAGQQIDPATYSPKTLSKVMRKRARLPVAECLTIALPLSRALMELHKNKLVHRDIKPSNIIFVNGCPKLADIGLVAPIDEARSYVGTEGFIPPEGPGTPQADIYSLGKVLYEIATGRDRQDFPDLPNLSELPDRDAFLELNEIIIEACNGNAQQRYQSAAELHADLLVVENGKSVRRLRTLERRWIALKRAATIAGAVLLIAGAIGYGVYSRWRSSDEARQRQAGAEIAYGNAALETGDYLAALPHFTSALLLDRPDAAHKRIHELRIGSLLESSPKLTHLWKRDRPVYDAEFSPDGKWAAFCEFDGKSYLYNLQTLQLSKPFGAATRESEISISPDGTRIVTCNQSGVCGVWNSTDLALVGRLIHPGGVYSLRFNTDGTQLLTSCNDGLARLWDVNTGKVIKTWPHKKIRFAVLSHNGKFVVTSGEDDMAQLWDINGSSPTKTLKHHGWVYCAAFSPDDSKLVTACGDHKARVWDVTTGRQLFPELTHLDAVQSVEFSKDGTLILTGSLDGTARLWRADTLSPVSENPVLRHSNRITRATFDRDHKRVLIAGIDGSVAVWDFSDCARKPVQITDADDLPLADTEDNPVRIARVAQRLNLAPTNITKVFFSRKRHAAVLRKRDSDTVEIWNVSDRKLITKINTGLSNCVPNDAGTRMLGYSEKLLNIWTFSVSTNPVTLKHANNIHSVAFNGAGDAAMTVSGNYILVWNATTGNPRFGPLQFPLPVAHAEFSPDGKTIAGCCADGSFKSGEGQLFDAKTGKSLCEPLNHNDGVLWITFSPDSKRVVTTGEDFIARIWDARTGVPIGNSMLHGEKAVKASFSGDGKMVATTSWDYTIRVWNAETGDPLTPRLRCETLKYAPIFTDHGVAILGTNGLYRTWRFSDHIPANDDLNALTMVLWGTSSLKRIDARHASVVQSHEQLWKSLQMRYPELFKVEVTQGTP